MKWYSIRAVYSHGNSDGPPIFEERIVLFRAEDVERAFTLAETESGQYLQVNPTYQRIGEWVAFEVAGGLSDLNKSEIWSGLSRSELSPERFYEQRYTAVELQPDEDDGAG
jgi:hypothetical protein